MHHTKSMEYIWANPRDREIYEESEFRVGESTGFMKSERFAWDIRQKWKGKNCVVVGESVWDVMVLCRRETSFPEKWRMSQAKRSFFMKLALSPTRKSLFSHISRSLGFAQMYSIDLVSYIRLHRNILHSLSRVCQGFMPIARHSHARTLFFHYEFSWLWPACQHRFTDFLR